MTPVVDSFDTFLRRQRNRIRRTLNNNIKDFEPPMGTGIAEEDSSPTEQDPYRRDETVGQGGGKYGVQVRRS